MVGLIHDWVSNKETKRYSRTKAQTKKAGLDPCNLDLQFEASRARKRLRCSGFFLKFLRAEGKYLKMLGALKGQPLVTKLAKVAQYGILPGAMIASLFYSPPDYASPKKPSDSKPPSSSSH
ncbi:hypothetical protein CDL12_22202 [Olea europaea subsp. europaea]|uniref:Uncharacterized protein n=1 Tax=Olea europaea subsp. europaea TaxID=158383 RepID=A0A8S0TLZ2_OLEEU|nr:hypothetical protein CDL12_22202 [Olea europaea subsp. europaea]